MSGSGTSHLIGGRVTAGGVPVSGLTVTVYARRLRSEKRLGKAETDSDGSYRIEYAPPKGAYDLVVRVVLDDENPIEVVRENPGSDETVDLTVPDSPEPEFARLLAEVTPLLDGAVLTDLTAGPTVPQGTRGDTTALSAAEKGHSVTASDKNGRAVGGDVGFLARATGRDAIRIGYLALAHRHAVATKLPAEAFYGLLRQGFPADLSALAKLPADDLVAGLTAAADTGAIEPVEHPEKLAAKLRAKEVAAFATATDGAADSPIAEILAVSVPDRKMRERIYSAYLDRRANNEGVHRYWAKLRIDKQVKPHADRFRLALQLGGMTGNNIPLVTALLAKFDAGELTHPRDLAGLDEAAWAGLVADNGGAPESARALLGAESGSVNGSAFVAGYALDDPDAAYPALISALVAEAYPTAHIAHRLAVESAKAPESVTVQPAPSVSVNSTSERSELVSPSGGKNVPVSSSRTKPAATDPVASAARFLTDNPEFDLVATPVNAATVPDEAARAELAGIQRLTKLTPTFEAVQALRGAGLDSAHAIVRTARDEFIAQFTDTLGPEQAAVVHARAGQVHAAAVNLIADLRTAKQFDVPWLAGPADAAALTAQIPDWEDLFGSLDYCSCSECRSVHSQPAYLVDLLLFLRDLGYPNGDPPAPDSEGTVADRLRYRRPDLWDIELTCDNTNLQLPYVDLVTEVLETVIVTGSTQAGATARQTSGDATQLRVQPQHLNPAAYDKVRTAVYPWSLPFDLWTEQTRVCLDHCEVPRDRLMAALSRQSALTAKPGLTTPEAVEHLGLSPVAGAIIAGEPLNPGRTLAEFYGRPAATTATALVEDLKNVRRLLDTGQLRYAELAELLATRFVNPTGTVTIGAVVLDPAPDPAPDPCDTNYLELKNLDVYTLDRLHRFVRLRRALGWSATELDQVLYTGPNRGRLDGATLRSVVAVQRLAARLGVTVEQTLCFYDTLPTHRYPTADLPPLYDRLFADPSVVQLEPGQVSPFELNAARTELRVVGSLTDPVVTAGLLAVLEVTDAELAELVKSRSSVAPNRLLNLANLSALYRTVTLARALDLPIPELLRLIELYGNGGPFPVPAEDYNGGEPDLYSGDLMRLPAGPPLTDGGPEPELGSGAAMTRPGHPNTAAVRLSPVDALIADTERFLDAVDEIRSRGFTVAEVDAVLTGAVPAHDGPLPDDATLAATLTGLRSALQAVYRQTATTTDEKGDLTRKSLALLGWDNQLVTDVVTTLLGTVEYAATLDALPAAAKLLTSMRFEPPAEGGPGTGRLTITGPMTAKNRTDLLATPDGGPAWKTAVQSLYDAPRRFITPRMKALRLPIYSVPLAVQPTDLKLPPSLVGKIFYDVGEHALRSKAYLSSDELDALKAGSKDAALHAAVEALGRVQDEPPAPDRAFKPDNVFLSRANVAELFDPEGVTPAKRFALVLTKLNPYLRRTLSEITVKQQLGAAVGLDAASTDVLLGTRLRSVSQPLALQDFLTPRFVGSDPAVVITRGGFGEQFATLTLLSRVALVLRRLRIGAEQIPWVFDFAASAGWLDLNLLPARPFPGASPLFGRFVRLLNCVRLRDGIPGAARTLRAVFTAARQPDVTLGSVLDELARQTSWDRADLDVLTGAGMLKMKPVDFQGEIGLTRLLVAERLLGALGVSAERAASWLPTDLNLAAAQAAWQTAKARHSLRDWPTVGGPLQDQLRERRRAALVDYLIANPLRYGENQPHWHDANTMFDYFLLDVEMGACQLTTRIAQAIFSVQLYVQRLRLNLETVAARDNADLWAQWEWLKSYRLWEANQKIFLYPENYFEPDLRASKTPFFTELENELKQKELTADHAETVFQHYLEQLDKVARLRPCGVYTDVEDPRGPTVHLVAHTVVSPREYYYRAWAGKTEWTPWQRLDLDIEADTLIPYVWNGRLYLFWPTYTFANEPTTVRMPEPNDPLPTPKNFWKAQLNWSRFAGGVWETKKTTKGYFKIREGDTFDPESPTAETNTRTYFFRPQRDPASNDLLIWVVWNTDAVYPDGQIGTESGFFRLSPGLVDPIIEQQKFRLAPYDQAVVPIVYQPTATHAYVHNHEKVEDPAEYHERRGKLYIYDPATRYYEDPSAVQALQQTPDSALYRVLNPSHFPFTRENFNPCFTEGSRTYLIDRRPVPVPLLRDPSGSTPGVARNLLALGAGSSLAVASHRRPEDATGWGIRLPGGLVAGSVLGQNRFQAEFGDPVKLFFLRLYHPHVRSFIVQLNFRGVSGLFNRELQLHPGFYTGYFNFKEHYQPNEYFVARPYPEEPVEFAFGDAYADYNWELFFHAPLLVAQRLSANQRFEEAQRWFHYIFDPTNRDPDADPPQRYWITKPFFEATSPTYDKQRIEKVLKALAEGDSDTTTAVNYWLKRPFQPDAVARLRTTAYQKAVVMKYLDNLIAWGDQLFRQDTLESINQATQLYILADELLGRRPDEITGRAVPAPKSYRQLLGTQTVEAIAAVENLIAVPAGTVPDAGSPGVVPNLRPGVNLRWLDYFCVPRNDKLVRYWDVVEDRLFKIRHCQNIDGVTRQTALFGAPIDPSLLVRAAAAGVDLNTVLDDANAPLPHYRFGPMVAKAKELTGEVKAFGGALLAALEKRDAEALARLRSGHELAVLQAARVVRQRQVTEAAENLEALTKSKETVEAKKTYYADKKKTNQREDDHNRLTLEALDTQEAARTVNIIASVVATIPDLKVGAVTTIGATLGGGNISAGLRGWSEALATGASMKQSRAALASTLGGYDHRYDDWQFQAKQADLELKQFDKQIAAAEIRYAIAQKELENHDLQRENAAEADRYLRDKFTDTELYDWMVGQLSTSYFQAYQLAYDVAKRAERAYRHELGLNDSGSNEAGSTQSSFINFGYWDSLYKGLLAGERLSVDLNRMDAAYLENNAREFELTKRISLAQLDPNALTLLKEKGTCFVTLPEAIFDVDGPGHYLRRIKNVAITVPCVAGPYSSVNLTARLLRSSVRTDATATSAYKRATNDSRFRDQTGPVQSIVTSTGQDDTGMFETNLRDERFLPFEGAGVIGEWQLSLPDEFRQFDYESITDVVLHLRYTARDGGEALATAAVAELRAALGEWVRIGGARGLVRTFSARREFSDQWNRFLVPSAADPARLEFTLARNRFPYPFREFGITVGKPEAVLVLSRNHAADDKSYLSHFTGELPVTLVTSAGSKGGSLKANAALDGQPHSAFGALALSVTEQDATVTFSIDRAAIAALPEQLREGDDRLNPDALVDLLLVCPYKLEGDRGGSPGGLTEAAPVMTSSATTSNSPSTSVSGKDGS